MKKKERRREERGEKMRGRGYSRWSVLNCPPPQPPFQCNEPEKSRVVILGELWKGFWRLNSSLAPWGWKDGGTKGLETVQR